MFKHNIELSRRHGICDGNVYICASGTMNGSMISQWMGQWYNASFNDWCKNFTNNDVKDIRDRDRYFS